jgi:phosphatidate cytidylyltransferase
LNNFVTRTISGAVFVVVVIGSILLNKYVFAGLMMVFIVWAMLEFYEIIIRKGALAAKVIGLLNGVFLFVAGFLYAQNIVTATIFAYLIPLTILLFMGQLYSRDNYSFRTITCTLTSITFIAAPFALLNGLAFPAAGGTYYPKILLGFFVLLWSNDTFAYLTGMKFGRRRLFERISPQKTWEGFFGGLVCTLALSLPVARFCGYMPFYHWMAVSAIIVVFGVYGDLIESLLKRNLKIKNSGRFLPGHGGILDRFDAMLFAAPMVYFYLKLFVF